MYSRAPGRLLRIGLSTESVDRVSAPYEWRGRYVGSKGLGARTALLDDALATGVDAAAERFGGDDPMPTVKAMELPVYDPRGAGLCHKRSRRLPPASAPDQAGGLRELDAGQAACAVATERD